MEDQGRRAKIITVPPWGGRDAGKHFYIWERDALDVERWGYRMASILKGTTAQIPETLISYGAVAPILMLIRAGNAVLATDLDYAKFIPAWDDLLKQMKFVANMDTKDALSGEPVARDIIWEGDAADIKEAKTVGWLRLEVLSLEINFSIVEELLSLLAALKSKEQQLLSNTQTSPQT